MTTPATKEIQAEITTAREVLYEAQRNQELGMLRAATSRAYYAIFHAARALLWSNTDFPKTHKGLSQQFSYLVKEGKIEPEFSDILIHAREERELADYHAITEDFSPEEVEELVKQATTFVERIETLLKV